MRCWIGTRHVRGRPRVNVRQNEDARAIDAGNSLGKRKRPVFDSESEDDETGSEQSVAENDGEPVQRLRSGFVDFVRQLQSRITTLEQETDLLKQENAHLVQSVISLRAGNSALQNRVELAVQQAEEGAVMSKKSKDDNSQHKKKKQQGDVVLNAETWKRSRGS